MRLHINHLILLEEKFGSFEVGCSDKNLSLRFGYWRKVPVDNLQSMLRALTLNSYIEITEQCIEDEDCGDLYNYIIKQNFNN